MFRGIIGVSMRVDTEQKLFVGLKLDSEMRRLHDPWRLWNQPADGLTPPPEGPLGGQGRAKKKQP